MAKRKRSPTVAVADAVAARFPTIGDAVSVIEAGRVRVDGRPVLNPRARVAATAVVAIDPVAELRGSAKLEAALGAFTVPVDGLVALDCGAAAGGFTAVLLRRGAARVYAVDAGHGQLRGALRQDPRVVVLERTNLGDLDASVVPDTIDLVTLDLSYLAVARAVPQLGRVRLATVAHLVALVKPMFELGLPAPPDDEATLAAARDAARRGVEAAGWQMLACVPSPVAGGRGATEYLLHARREIRPD